MCEMYLNTNPSNRNHSQQKPLRRREGQCRSAENLAPILINLPKVVMWGGASQVQIFFESESGFQSMPTFPGLTGYIGNSYLITLLLLNLYRNSLQRSTAIISFGLMNVLQP